MRDPARIPVVIAALARLWAKQPDLRLYQLMENLGGDYYTEDTALLCSINENLEED